MMAINLIEDNDPIARTKDLLGEWGKFVMYNVWREHGYKMQGWVKEMPSVRSKNFTAPAISPDEVRVIESLMSGLFSENWLAWQALKLYYTRRPDANGNWTQERVAKSMRCRKELAAEYIDQGIFYINENYAERAKKFNIYR